MAVAEMVMKSDHTCQLLREPHSVENSFWNSDWLGFKQRTAFATVITLPVWICKHNGTAAANNPFTKTNEKTAATLGRNHGR